MKVSSPTKPKAVIPVQMCDEDVRDKLCRYTIACQLAACSFPSIHNISVLWCSQGDAGNISRLCRSTCKSWRELLIAKRSSVQGRKKLAISRQAAGLTGGAWKHDGSNQHSYRWTAWAECPSSLCRVAHSFVKGAFQVFLQLQNFENLSISS